MLFTTAPFLLLFLPVTLTGFFMLGRWAPRHAASWLCCASLFFYAYWMPTLVALLLASVGINFVIGQQIARQLKSGSKQHARRWLVLGVTLNLAALGYYKYANFMVDNLNAVMGVDWHLGKVILPIGISFYSFTQIAFLVDAFEGKVNETKLVHYGLFVTYFPHLVAGPVLHHAQMMPQFADPAIYRPRADHLVAGLAILALGLFKKVVLADGIAPYADAVFSAADTGTVPTAGEAWLGAVAYSLQLYFDFSGYSDMAIGLSWLFNIRLPFNFESPYRARNITDFWRCWHMSLSNFLRDYLYIPLGGNRRGPVRRYVNLGLTMVLGGLWHGASWSFAVWGALHGAYLMLNHGYRAALGRARWARLDASLAYRSASWMLTLLAVVVAWVFFRAETLPGALTILLAMANHHAAPAELPAVLWNAGLPAARGWLWCAVLGTVALFGVNSNRIGVFLLGRLAPETLLRPLLAGVSLCAVGLLLLINLARDSVSAFIYFNF